MIYFLYGILVVFNVIFIFIIYTILKINKDILDCNIKIIESNSRFFHYISGLENK